MTDHDRRVVDSIVAELAAYQLGMTDPATVITKVGRLLGELRDVRPAEVEELRRVWWEVEFSLALSRDQERELREEELELLERSASELEAKLTSDQGD